MSAAPLKDAVETLARQPRWARHLDGENPEIRKLAFSADADRIDGERIDLERALRTACQALVTMAEK